MGVDLLDLVFRIERAFEIKIRREQFFQIIDDNDPPDIKVGDLFDFSSRKARQVGVFDQDPDSDALWALVASAVSQSMGTEPGDVSKDRWLIRELGRG